MEEDKPKEMTLDLRPDLLYRPLHFLGYSKPDPNADFHLYDRVVNVRSGISVPLGLKGVVIGIHIDPVVEVNTVYDVLFDEEFPGGVALRCSPGRGYKMSGANLINLTFGASLSPKKKTSKTTVVHTALQPNRLGNDRRKAASQGANGHVAPVTPKKGNSQQSDRRNGSAVQADVQPKQILQRQNPRQRVQAPKPSPKAPMMTLEQVEQSMRPPPAPSPKHVKPKGLVFKRMSPTALLMNERQARDQKEVLDNGLTSKRPVASAQVSITEILENAGQCNPVHVSASRPQANNPVHVATPRPQAKKKEVNVQSTGNRNPPQLPFVPIQVTRQSKTPVKPPGKEVVKKVPQTAASSSVAQTVGPTTSKNASASGQPMMSLEALEKQLHRTNIRETTLKTSESTESEGKKTTTPGSNKKRLAINL